MKTRINLLCAVTLAVVAGCERAYPVKENDSLKGDAPVVERERGDVRKCAEIERLDDSVPMQETIKRHNNMNEELKETMCYTAQAGDTVEHIAGKFNMWSRELYELNNKDGKKSWSIKKGDRVRVRRMPATYICSEPAVASVYTETLWNIRKALKKARANKKVDEGLTKLWDECKKASPTDKTLLQAVRDRDVLMPILRPLSHIKLGEHEYLDCCVRGDDMGAFGKFVIRTEDEVKPLAVRLDGTPESAWERVLLKEASEQFFLAWHANYCKHRIVSDVRRFDDEINIPFVGERAWITIGESGRSRMMKNDFAPTVVLTGNHATVTYYIFSAFGGLLKLTDHVDMLSGEILGKTEMEQIVEYNCGVCY